MRRRVIFNAVRALHQARFKLARFSVSGGLFALTLTFTLALTLTLAGTSAVFAQQSTNTRTLRLVVPMVAGNSTDLMARSVAEFMRKDLNQSLIVENKAGGNASIGASFVAAQPPDSLTMLLASDSSLVLNTLLYKKLSYDPAKDFSPVGIIADVPLVVAINAQLPINSLAELVAYAKAHPGELNFGSTGIGGAFHLTTEMLKLAANIDMVHVPYPGGAPATAALIAGNVQLMSGAVGSMLPHLKSGKLRALAVTTPRRLAVLPDVPTVAETYPGFDSAARYGLVVRSGADPAQLARLNGALNKALADPVFRKHFEDQGYVVYAPHTPADYTKIIEADRVRWAKVIKEKNISLD